MALFAFARKKETAYQKEIQERHLLISLACKIYRQHLLSHFPATHGKRPLTVWRSVYTVTHKTVILKQEEETLVCFFFSS